MKNFIRIRGIFAARREVQQPQQLSPARAELIRLSRIGPVPLFAQRPTLHVFEGGGESTDQRADLTVVETVASVVEQIDGVA